VAGPCNHSTEHSSSITNGEFIQQPTKQLSASEEEFLFHGHQTYLYYN